MLRVVSFSFPALNSSLTSGDVGMVNSSSEVQTSFVQVAHISSKDQSETMMLLIALGHKVS